MSKERQKQIALLFIKEKIRKEGIIRLTPSLKREIGSIIARSIGISIDEAMEFVEDIVRELVDETFAK